MRSVSTKRGWLALSDAAERSRRLCASWCPMDVGEVPSILGRLKQWEPRSHQAVGQLFLCESAILELTPFKLMIRPRVPWKKVPGGGHGSQESKEPRCLRGHAR